MSGVAFMSQVSSLSWEAICNMYVFDEYLSLGYRMDELRSSVYG